MSDNRNYDNEMDRTPADNIENQERTTIHTSMRPDQSQNRTIDQPGADANTEDANSGRKKKDTSNIEDLANDVRGGVGSRVTGSNSEDIAGVADIDRGLER
ncbi:hypothetical protein [Chryseosolibacter indicus]|uniref:Uncharacterized protein n=1 Tax=Chryseosolibacter indicus TaxID=2782351 RepID=A0ABS5VPM4_9BACT|nr:hypothetical protein [Chryseosolibacter indicus]MBT1703393.1 hypothetical protein [Chryseosolibacter indicus]